MLPQSNLEVIDQDLNVTLRDFSNNKEVIQVSSKLAKAVGGLETFLKEKSFSIRP